MRASLGQLFSDPRAVSVTVHDGVVTLTGSVPIHARADLVRRIRAVRGVSSVEDYLAEVADDDGIRPGPHIDILQRRWAPATRVLAGGIGVGLTIVGVSSTGLVRPVASIVSLVVLLRAIMNPDLRLLTEQQSNKAKPA